MFSHILKQAFRFLSRKKVFTIINDFGLALSLACCIVLTRYLHQEYSVDKNAIESETIYQVVNNSDNSFASPHIHQIKFEAFNAYLADSCCYMPMHHMDLQGDSTIYVADVLLTDSAYLHFFELKIKGDRHALNHRDGALISRSCAGRIFGDEEPLGKSFSLLGQNFTIQGIFDEPGCKRSVNAEVIISNRDTKHQYQRGHCWGEYLRLQNKGDVKKIEYVLRETNYRLCPLSEMYFKHSDNFASRETDMMPICNLSALRILTGADILILLIGIFNFINIYMVLMQRRRHEWGVRKVFGQTPLNLFVQAWIENLIQVIISVFVAWMVVELSREHVNEIFEEVFLYSWFDFQLTMAILLFVPLVVAIYPFVQYIIHSPLLSLKSSTGGKSDIKVRVAFLGFQYLLTLCIVICAIWFNRHLSFLQKCSSSFSTERVLVTDCNHFGNNNFDYSIFQAAMGVCDAIEQSPHLEMYNLSGDNTPIIRNKQTKLVTISDDTPVIECTMMYTTPAMLQMFGHEFVQGGLGSDEDSDNGYHFYINETALRMLGRGNIDNLEIHNAIIEGEEYETSLHVAWYAVDKYFQWGTRSHPAKVTGVVKDFYTGHASEGVCPLVLICKTQETGGLYIGAQYTLKVKEGHLVEVLNSIGDALEKGFGSRDFTWHWYQQEVEDLYKDDRRLSRISSLFAMIAIMICCLGLFGLSLFDIRQRYREIAIRKAHGAHRKDLYLLLGKKYFYILLFTFMLSIPVSYLLIHRYTESFIEYAPLTPIIYIEALGIVLLITLLTLVYQLEKAARVNVASVGKTE